MTKPIGIVTGLQLEADIARGFQNAEVLCLGPGPDRARQAAQALLDEGAASLMSFGIAGGLNPALAASDILRNASGHKLVTVPEPALTPDAKARLFAETGADGVDMETSAVRDVAQRAGLPFQFIRVICDEAADRVPALALKGVAADGSTTPVKVAAGLLTRPGDLPALVTLGARQKRAVKALQDIVQKERLQGV